MINITLPDGKVLSYETSVSSLQIAKDISPSLAKRAVAVAVNGQALDLATELANDAAVKIITSQDHEGLEIIRHDAAHLLAQAVKRLYPKTQIVLGPVIENGFYYDLLPETPFSEEDLDKLEAEMRKISAAGYPISRSVISRDEAINFFRGIGEEFKAKIIEEIPVNQTISLYKQGEFTDLCRGPHAPSTAFCKHFKLMKVSGSYWRGDSQGIQLQRIYGTAWATAEELASYLHMLEEAERRDHRKLGKQLDLFHLQDEAPGAVFWHDKGYTIYRTIQDFVRQKIRQHDYIEVKTPILVNKSLWEKSGHWEKFRENMFVTEESENKLMCLKPMNCPCHVEIFKNTLRSYRELPMRMAEFGCCNRNEPSGSLHGLMRVREFVQDDAHIFCTEDQIVDETCRFVELLQEIYAALGFTEITVKFSDRPDKRAGTDETWDKAERSLTEAVTAAGLSYTLNKGEGAFYGPKLEFVLKDAIGRDWQCGTFQVDFVLPERLGATYVDSSGKKAVPVMLHRAVLGSLERFIGILIENCEGKFPFWLAPVQVVVLPITDAVADYGQKVCDELKRLGIRAELDDSSEKLDYRIRKHSLTKVPMLIVVGNREKENGTVTVRFRSLSKLAPAEQMQGAHGAQKPTCTFGVHEAPSTGATQQMPAEVEFGERSGLGKSEQATYTQQEFHSYVSQLSKSPATN